MNVKTSIATGLLIGAACAFGATVTVVVPQEGAAKSATVGNKASAEFNPGATAALKATANKGYAFAGWYLGYDADSGAFSNEVALANGADWRSPTAKYVVGDDDVTIYARFAAPASDALSFNLADTFAAVSETTDLLDRPVMSLTNELDIAVQMSSLSLPTVTMSGLPDGLKFDKSTLRITGTPKATGVYKLTASAKNASGYTYSQVYYVRVGNAVAEHVEGTDGADFYVGESTDEFLETFFYISNTNSSLKTVSLTGLPSGISLVSEDDGDYVYYSISGVPKKAGDYVVTCKATFEDRTTESATALFTVNAPSPFDYDGNVDFETLAGRYVGDSIRLGDEVVLGEYYTEDKLGVLSVSGLPTGITATKVESDEGLMRYVLSGMFTKPGEFTVSVKVSSEDWFTYETTTETLSQKIIVADAVGSYLAADVLDPTNMPKCKVTGSGVYAAGTTAKLAATAGSGYVFAGWCDSAGVEIATGAQDYRKSPLGVAVCEGVALDWYANFIPKEDDYMDMSALDGREITIDTAGNDEVGLSFFVNSGSLPTIKFKNLPSGFTCEPSSDMAGEYVLSYDPASVKKAPLPGKYAVTATGTNVSRASDEATFEVTVLNYTDEGIAVEDDYGILTPNVAMAPISLSNAVNFARGDTLKVSGLPTGVKYDDKAAPLSLSGTPTKPGNYTIIFTAKIVTDVTTNSSGRVTYTTRTGTATAFITVKDFPTVAAVIDETAEGAGNKVTGTGSFQAGKKTTLKAAAAKGWVFAGWGENSGLSGLESLNPSLAYVVGTNDLTEMEANFIEVRDDTLFIDDPGVVAIVKGEDVSTNLVELITTTCSLPKFTVKGLPSGLTFDAKTFLVTGSVKTSAKSGYYYVTLTASNAGGYAYTRILKFVLLDSVGEDVPDEEELANDASIDFSVLDDIYTGDYCPETGVDALALYVEATNDTEVTAAKVSGLPTGLKAAVTVEDGVAEVVLYGTPTKADRYTLKVDVTYSDRSRATSQYAFIVQDGGSAWLDVDVFDSALGTATGSGVYSSGAKVKLAAKPASGCVFAGWYEDDAMPFAGMGEMDGVDYRTAAASFVFRRGMFENDPPTLLAAFVAKEEDAIAVSGLEDVWEIDPADDGELEFTVSSASLPKLTVTGLPKGVELNAAAGKFVYSSESQSKIVPGYYTVKFKATNLSNVSAEEVFTVFVANKTTEAIDGLDSSADAYALSAGVSLDPELIMPEVDSASGWKLTVAGLPSGLSLKSVKNEDGTIAYHVEGVATKASTNTVTFTASLGSQKEVATITVCVSALPEWAYGTYDGAYYEFDGDGTNVVGQVTATVSNAGKVSGKVLKGGKTYSFKADSYVDYDEASDCFTAEVVVPWSASDTETFLLSVGSEADGLGIIKFEPVGDGAYFAEAIQNAWLRKDMDAPAFATGAKQPEMEIDEITCKFGAKGAVQMSGQINGVRVNGKAQALMVSDDATGANSRFVLYFANAKFEGGAFAEVIDVMLSDSDGDGKIDTAEIVE